MNDSAELQSKPLIVSFRGKKFEYDLLWSTLVLDVKSHLAASLENECNMEPSDVKLIHKGKVLSDNEANLYNILVNPAKRQEQGRSKPIRLMATGVSSSEAEHHNEEFNRGRQNAPRVRDDLSRNGRAEIAARQQLGMKILSKASNRYPSQSNYGFGKIETLPMLPEQNKAKDILQSLANDPGILACMAKHKWNVGCLAELYPEGKVGESEVCVMGLNRNQGQQILLRLRTDDLKGFRKILNIKKVLYHELAHNVHSDHDQDFFKLMRQIEAECHELNWTKNGNTVGGGSASQYSGYSDIDISTAAYQGGAYRLGDGNHVADQSQIQSMSTRELAARAAMVRMSQEEMEIEQACGCGRSSSESQGKYTQSATTTEIIQDEEEN